MLTRCLYQKLHFYKAYNFVLLFRMVRKIKLPDSGDLEAAAANFGAKRAAEMTAEKSMVIEF